MAVEDQHPSNTRSLNPLERKTVVEMQIRNVIDRDIFSAVGNGNDNTYKVELAYAKGFSEEDAPAEFQSGVYVASRFANQQVGLNLLTKACKAISRPSVSRDETVCMLNVLARTMRSLKPLDEVEGQLIAQLVVLQEQYITWLGKAMSTDRVEFANTYLNGASKLLARHHEILATLLKYHRGDERRVHVEHVHVCDGGKTIVGNVKIGGGLKKKMRMVFMQRCRARSKRSGEQCKNYAICIGVRGDPKTF
jgi:hypothetical protein